MSHKDGQFYSSDSKHLLERNLDYQRYPFFFYTPSFVSRFNPAKRYGLIGLQRRRVNNEYRLQSVFFESFFISSRKKAWLLTIRPSRVVGRPTDYYKYPSVFWNVKDIQEDAVLLWATSRPDKAVHSSSEKYRRSMYPSVFMLPKLVPNAGFGSTELEEWTETDKRSTTWTETDH